MMDTIVRFDNVGMSFGKFQVHKNISFSIGSGEVVTILGPSGTGKTIILKIIIGLLNPTHGKVTIMGKDTSQLSPLEERSLRQNIGMLFQGAALFDSLTVFENVAYSLRAYNIASDEEISKIVAEKLDIIGLPDIGNKYPPELSGGQKKRVGLARALASSPKIMLFDEPTTGLDPTARRMIDELIIDLKQKFGITSVVVTHDIDSAKMISDRWILIDKGSVIADGPVNQISADNKTVKQFITGHWDD